MGNTQASEIVAATETLKELNLRTYSSGELEDLTDNFSETNLFGETEFGKVYRGRTEQGQDVTVKIWEDVGHWPIGRHEHRLLLMDECVFLTQPFINHHPNLPKLLGYCWEDSVLGVVYDLKPLDTLPNLIPKDDFSWLQRMNVAINLTHVIEFLHGQEPPYLVRNIGTPHIMVDQGYNPVILDLCMTSGGIHGRNRRLPHSKHFGLVGYTDPIITTSGTWLKKCDAFSFGAVLLELISKRLYKMDENPPVYVWAKDEYNKKENGTLKFSLVHGSLEKDPKYSENDGCIVTKAALECVVWCDTEDSWKMTETARSLESLDVVHFLNEVGNPSDACRRWWTRNYWLRW